MKDLYCSIEFQYTIDIDLTRFVGQQTRCSIDLLSKEIHKWVEDKINAVVLWIEVFYLPPYRSYDIHCDGHEVDNKCKLNYIVGGEGSTMYWYKAINNDRIISAYSKSNTKYLKLEKNNAEEIGKATLINLNLVNVGNFHTVINGENNRWCISIVVGDKITEERLNYDEVKSRLNIK